MVELLAEAKARLLAERQSVTSADFEREWSAAWDVMTAERAWQHATEPRAAFLDRPTTFGSLAQSLTAASARLHIALAPEDLPHVLIGAIQAGYSIAGESTVQEDPREGVLM
jgi:hypothetical protein